MARKEVLRLDYTGWSEEELLARRDELEDEIADLELARDLEYLVEEGFITVEQLDGDWCLFVEELPADIPSFA